MPSGSYSLSFIQDYIEYIIKKHETLTVIFPTHVYNRINNRLRFKMKKSKLVRIRNARNNNNIWQNKKIIDKTKNGEIVSRLEVVEMVLAQCNLVDN